jgi:hypothetical protein
MWLRRWRAARREYQAEQAYRRHPSYLTAWAWNEAADARRYLYANRP